MTPQRISETFAFNLFRSILQEQTAKNVFISPLSIRLALSLLANGAGESTLATILGVLAPEGVSLEALNMANSQLMKILAEGDNEVQLHIANSLWLAGKGEFNQTFLANNREFYEAEATRVDFTDPDIPHRINQWVSKQTQGKIAKIVGDAEFNEATLLVLLNAIYFKGKWTFPFNRDRTEEHLFTLLDGQKQKVQLMNQSGNFDYYEEETFQAVRLLYQHDLSKASPDLYSLYIFLPAIGAYERFRDGWQAGSWQTWLNNFAHKDVNIGLPRFKLDYSLDLKPVLARLGLDVIFAAEKADFSKMVATDFKPPRIAVDKAVHKCFVEVNEEGTEAAAVTKIEMMLGMALPSHEKVEFIVDRPFFCLLTDKDTGAILFLGTIVNPSE